MSAVTPPPQQESSAHQSESFEVAVIDMFHRLPGVSSLPSPREGVDLMSLVEGDGPGGLQGTVLVVVKADIRDLDIALFAMRPFPKFQATEPMWLVVTATDVSHAARETLTQATQGTRIMVWGRSELRSLLESYPNAFGPIFPFIAQQSNSGWRAEVKVVRVADGWHLVADAYVLPLGPRGGGTGTVYRALMADLGAKTAARIEARIREEVKEGFSPQRPVVEPVYTKEFPRQLILATAYAADMTIVPGVTVRAILHLAESSEFDHIILPILDSALLDMSVAINEIASALADTCLGRKLLVTVVVVDEDTEKLAQRLVWPQPEPARLSSRVLHYNSDAVDVIDDDSSSFEDKLGVDTQARTFARLLADTHVTLPLAIGLFGNWGSGKTFFMKLIRQEMENILPEDRRSEVAHVTFNAWHYLDTSLWASLGLRIFEGVANHLVLATGHGKALSATATEIARLTAQIDSTQRAKAAAEQQLRAAEKARRASEANIADKAAQRARKAQSIGIAVLTKYLGDDWAKEFRRQVVAFGGGSPTTLAEMEQAIAKAAQIRAGLERLLPGFVLRLPRFGRVLVVVGGGLAVGLMWEHHGMAVDWVWPWVAQWWPWNVDLGLGGRLASAAGLASWIAQRLAAGREAAEHLKRLADRVQLARAAAAKEDQKVADLNALDGQIADHRRRIVEAEHEMASAAARLQQVEAGALVYDFLAQRGADSRYIDNTGIIATLRRDLKTLEENLADLKQPVRRVILYVDDLDRCDPDRVVEVLQAVHLLLAFKLFAVVVAVDPRWLERSLYKRYLANFADMTEDQRAASEFSPHNYLEKIFQIPFHLPRLVDGERSRDRFRQLVDSLVPKAPTEIMSNTPEDNASSVSKESPTQPPPEGQARAEPPDTLVSWWSRLLTAVIRWRPDAATATPGAAPQAPAFAQAQAANHALSPTLSLPAPLLLTQREHHLLASMHPFIPTPRAAKRLVNVYLLIRLQVENESPALGNRMKAEGDQAALALITLLAIDIGFPRPTQLLRSMLNKPQTTDLLAALAVLRQRCGLDNVELGHQCDNLTQALQRAEVIPSITDLRQWLPFANRFSFHSPENPDDTLAELSPTAQESPVDK